MFGGIGTRGKLGAEPARSRIPRRGRGRRRLSRRYALTYLLTIAVVSGATVTSYASAVIGEPDGTTSVRVVGWVFYNAHFVSSNVPELFGPEGTNLLAELPSLTLLVFAVPALCLFTAGLVTRGRVARLEPRGTVSHGLCVLLGYTPAVLVGAILITETTARGASGPEPLAAVVVAGVLYPAVFTVAGAVAGNRLFG